MESEKILLNRSRLGKTFLRSVGKESEQPL